MSSERHPWGADGRPIDWPEPTVLDAIGQRDPCPQGWCCTACQGTGWAGQDPCSDCYGSGHKPHVRQGPRMTTTNPIGDHRPCLAGQPSHDHDHRCGAPYGHGGPEHCCQVCGGWYRSDGGEATA